MKLFLEDGEINIGLRFEIIEQIISLAEIF